MHSPLHDLTTDIPLDEPSDESDVEYEYDKSETETFYINLDLTSCNGPIRPPRQRTFAPADPIIASAAATSSRTGSPVRDSPGQNQAMSDEPNLDTELQSQIQIMELHSPNPIISYHNQIFSCSWADNIGTDMMFSLPEDDSDLALRQTRDFDLISTTRVKILGQKAHVISGSSSSQAQRIDSADALSGQAQFLACLMRVKKAKGEQDEVRTVFPAAQKRNENLDEKLQSWARTEGLLTEMEQLNEQAFRGDIDSVKRLEEIYMQFDAALRSSAGIGVPETTPTSPTQSQAQEVQDLPGANEDK
ncbi:predicted protein [Uncinocarpus reesii 1704]|uniref:Transcription factor TFIIIC triple barrel domain-containing protein n=1 Tax=Uncinocarpus reesii (strain UAMH 1704) TaxID=336963 RepID=C4JF26_UNCRE|nr:uncharacterized protein UREG_00927 [Uncinocarpus reesii 1704]EEP76079.1 predicted protein [Uncinocarpus reesii 1704]